ncbi:MAG: MFS transporter [Clostridia bacterium]|nr:MFS transporter [Clostridia bacterium]
MNKEYKKTMAACCSGYVTQSIVVNLAPLFFVIFRNDFRFSYSFIATVIFVTFVIQIAVDAMSVKFMGRLGYRRCAVLSQVFSAAGILMLGLFPMIFANKHAAFLIAVTFYSIGGALMEVVISPIIDAIPSSSGGASMAFLHSFYSWGQVAVILLTTSALALIGHTRWYLIPFVWTALPIFNTFAFLKVPIIEPEAQNVVKTTERLFKRKLFLVSMLLMICAGAAEQIMAQWASLFCERGLGVDKVVGDLVGPCLFAAFMAIGRMWYGIKGDKVDLKRAIVACSSLSVVCYLVTVFSPFSALSLAGCALCGLGVSLLWPGMLSATSQSFPDGGPALFAYLALGGDLGCALGPYIAGVVSDSVSGSAVGSEIVSRFGLGIDEVSLKAGILAGIIFPVVMLIGSLALGRNRTKHKNNSAV